MYRLFLVLLTFSLISLNAHAAKGGRWGGAGGSDPGTGAQKPGKKEKTPPAEDSVGPVISLPGNLTISATTGAGAIVTYSASANDAVDGSVAMTCSPQSGQVFPLGATSVQCSATDLAGNVSSDSFTVAVIDDQPPVITAPAIIQQSSPDGAAVAINFAAFEVAAIDMVDSQVDFSCAPASGSAFAVGTTAVSCAATDDAQNTASAQFSVVIDDATPTPTPVNTPPQLAFATPAANALLSAGDSLAVNLNASDSDGSIQYCTLHLNGVLLRQENVSPYQWGVENNDPQLASMAEGEYSLVAACTDSGNLMASVQTTVLVQAAPEPEPEPTIANVLLDWVVPATREDGTALPASEIDSYEIYYYLAGNQAAGMSLSVESQDLAGNLISSYPINSLASGQYYFSIATVDTGGNVSEFVTPVSLTLQ